MYLCRTSVILAPGARIPTSPDPDLDPRSSTNYNNSSLYITV